MIELSGRSEDGGDRSFLLHFESAPQCLFDFVNPTVTVNLAIHIAERLTSSYVTLSPLAGTPTPTTTFPKQSGRAVQSGSVRDATEVGPKRRG